MTKRSYTVNEVDALRRAINNQYLYGSYNPTQNSGISMSRSYREDEKASVVEEMVRTAMLVGHTADDLYASERPNQP
jgi:hypothetical protein